MKRDYHRWYSPNLGREMELLVFGSWGARVVVFPPRLGRFYDYENWGIINALRNHVDRGWVQLFCLDSYDASSLYADWLHPRDRIQRHEQYERYVLDEVLPLTERVNSSGFLTSLGCSLGAYHAANIALRHPHRFNKLVALSGRFDLTRPVEHFRDLFDGYYDEKVYLHTPCHYLPNLHDDFQLNAIRRMEIILAIGEDDPFRDTNHKLSTTLWEKGAWNALNLWRGRAHRAADWRHMIPAYV